MNALDMLRKMLDEAKIPYESYQKEWLDKEQYAWDKTEGSQWYRNQIIYGRHHDKNWWKLDAIFQYGSFGREENCVETYGDLGVDEDGNPRVMSAEEAFAIIKEDWDKMNEVEGGGRMRLNAETEEKTTYAFIKSTEKHTIIEGYVKTWWTENGVIGVTFVNDNTYITGANNVLIQETK